MSHYVDWLLPRPLWRRKGSNKLLLASRRSDDTRRRKTAGNIADGLRCCIWSRADKPEKITHQLVWGGKNQTGYIALLHPNALASRQPQYFAEHRLLSFLGKILRATIPEESVIVRTALEAEVSSTTSIPGACSGPQTTSAILAYQLAEKIRECAQSICF